jgi:ATP-dependent Clp protease ATP-binding subunit ClpA
MRPELLNRLDGTIVFHPLTDESIRSIARLHLDDAVRRLKERGWALAVNEDVEDLLVQRGFSREYGARPLLRTIEDLVLRPLARVPAGRYVLEVHEAQTRARPES